MDVMHRGILSVFVTYNYILVHFLFVPFHNKINVQCSVELACCCYKWNIFGCFNNCCIPVVVVDTVKLSQIVKTVCGQQFSNSLSCFTVCAPVYNTAFTIPHILVQFLIAGKIFSASTSYIKINQHSKCTIIWAWHPSALDCCLFVGITRTIVTIIMEGSSAFLVFYILSPSSIFCSSFSYSSSSFFCLLPYTSSSYDTSSPWTPACRSRQPPSPSPWPCTAPGSCSTPPCRGDYHMTPPPVPLSWHCVPVSSPSSHSPPVPG